MKALPKYLFVLISLQLSLPLSAHHVLGRPAYSLNEDSNTPPSMAVEAQIGQFFVTYMVFPAFPKPNEQGRVNLYATRIDNGKTFDGEVSFYVRDDRWLARLSQGSEEKLGVQRIDDGVYRQGFLFNKEGSYIIRASFEVDGEPYDIDFPLQVGKGSPVGTIGASVGLLVLILLMANVVQGRRLIRAKAQSARNS
jgi:hypothetical protein